MIPYLFYQIFSWIVVTIVGSVKSNALNNDYHILILKNIIISFFKYKAKNGDGSRRSVKEVLEYLLQMDDVKEAIRRGGKTIKLRFAADGRRTSKRIGTVMAVFNILAENRHSFEYQYTLALYNGKYI